MNRSQHQTGNASVGGVYGDGGNRTHATFPASTVLKGWALALRDLCDQGAHDGRLTIAPGAVVLYSPGKGARFLFDGQAPVTLTDAELDTVDLTIADIPLGLRDLVAAGVIEVEQS